VKENVFKMSPQTSELGAKAAPKLTFKDANIATASASKSTQPSTCKSDDKAKKLKWEPSKWTEQLSAIKDMRSELNAPVDTMGCVSHFNHSSPAHVKRYHILISLMLSSQTKDEVTAAAMGELHKLPLEIDVILAIEDEKLEQAIYPASFYKRKAQYIKKTSQILKDKYNYDIPDSVDELCQLPGVGPKMAYLTMSCAWKRVVGIGVDTHVHRIANRLGWTRTSTKTPEQTRKELEDWLPQLVFVFFY
jgi:endonuclease-3